MHAKSLRCVPSKDATFKQLMSVKFFTEVGLYPHPEVSTLDDEGGE